MVWLEITRPDATTRQALIYGGDVVLPQSETPYCGDIVMATWSFTRHPRIEGDMATLNVANLSLDGNPADLDTLISGLGGVAPGRIERITLTDDFDIPTGGTVISEGWIGIQPDYEDGGNFDPVINLGLSVPSFSFLPIHPIQSVVPAFSVMTSLMRILGRIAAGSAFCCVLVGMMGRLVKCRRSVFRGRSGRLIRKRRFLNLVERIPEYRAALSIWAS